MSTQRITVLINSIKQKQLKSSFSTSKISSIIDIHPNYTCIRNPIQQFNHKIKQTQRQYDQLLLDCLSLIQLIDDVIKINGQQYGNLTDQLEVQKVGRKQDYIQFQDNITMMNNKIDQLHDVISNKQEQNLMLRNFIQQKQQQIQQIQAENNAAIKKLQQIYSSRIEQQYSSMSKQNNQQKLELSQKIKQLQNQNKQYFNQNVLLSSRLQQILKYVKELQQKEENIKSQYQEKDQESYQRQIQHQLSPRLLYNYRSQQSESPYKQGGYERQSSQKIKNNYHIDEIGSCEGQSAKRMVLHQILNTEDRKSINFGNNDYSKSKKHLIYSNDQNNFNTINKTDYQNQTIDKQKSNHNSINLNIIKQFKADHTENTQCQQNQHNLHIISDDPYYIFFTLISQCAKINSCNLQLAAKMNLNQYWSEFLENKIPLHQWHSFLVEKINLKI